MSISSVGPASQLYSAQQVQALSAAFAGAPADSTPAASAIPASGSNSLTGTTTSNLDSQTLQALLDLTQQDPANGTDPSQAGQTGQTDQAGQAQSTHHHHGHHHGGGMMQAQSSDPSQLSTTTAKGGQSLTAAVDTSDDTSEASLTSALMNA
jgi:hypothetical protein